jgi:hypothetical protein
MGGCSSGDSSQQVPCNYDICRSTANTFCSSLAEWIDAAWAHVAVPAAKAQFSETTLRLLLVEPILCRLEARFSGDSQHLLTGRVY